MRPKIFFGIGALLVLLGASFTTSDAAPVDLTGPLVLNISGAPGAPLSVDVSSTGSIFADISPVDFLFQTPLALVNIQAAGTITYGSPVPPWPYVETTVITAIDVNPFTVQGDVLLRFLVNDGSPSFGSVKLTAQHDINIGSYPAAVPLPPTLTLFILGLLVIGLLLFRPSCLDGVFSPISYLR